jgi:hypothetical protein
MLELLGGGIFGSLLGGVFRLAPEAMKFFDKKNERQHELKMFEQQCQLETLRGNQKMAEIGAQREATVDTGVMDAFNSAVEQQTEMVKVAGGWAASLSASVRPVLTYWVWLLYSAAFITLLWVTWQMNHNPQDIVKLVLTPDFMALLGGITNYYFLNRTIERRGL